jgi:hypothetical protein
MSLYKIDGYRPPIAQGLGFKIRIFIAPPLPSRTVFIHPMPSTASPIEEINPLDLVVITSSRVILDDRSRPVPATLELSALSGKFIAVHPGKATRDNYHESAQFMDYGDLVVMPGLVDSHVHIDEP